MSIYSYFTYQEAIEQKLRERRSGTGPRLTQRQLAEAAGIQPSFFTNVLKRRFDFNPDQLYAIGAALDFSSAERRFLLLLLEYQRSTHKARREELKKEIEGIRKEHQKTERHISIDSVDLSPNAMAEYYLDPFVQLVHVHLNLATYSSDTEKLRVALGLSRQHLQQIIATLVRIGYVKSENGRLKVIASDKHLPKEDPLCGPHQALMRLKSIDQLQRISADERYSVSATLTGSPETRTQLQEAFLKFLKDAEAIVKSAESRHVYQMNFDLFPWEI